MFGLFKKKKRNQSENPLARYATPLSSEEAAQYRRPEPQNLEQEFMSVYMQTRSAPLGNYEAAWNWMIGKMRSFRSRGLAQDRMLMLAKNLMLYMTPVYRERIGEFLEVAEPDMIVICVAELLRSGDRQKARMIAEPLWAYSRDHMKELDLSKDEIIILAMAVTEK